jgi:transcriptional regulator with GAF, ATPase, and Fis domain
VSSRRAGKRCSKRARLRGRGQGTFEEGGDWLEHAQVGSTGGDVTDRISSEEQKPDLTRELDDLRSRQEAVANILRALSTSGMRLQAILDEIVQAAARLCRADGCFIYLADGDLFRMRAHVGAKPEVVEYERQHPDRAGPGSATGRAAMTRQPVHIPDVGADPGYTHVSRDLDAFGTLLSLPVLFNDELVGVFGSRAERCRRSSRPRSSS